MPGEPFFSARREGSRFVIQGEPHYARNVNERSLGGSAPFAQWHWNGDSLSISNCRYGVVPLYYSVTDDSIAISPSALRLAREGFARGLDYDALSVFLRRSWFLGDDTPFKGIKRLAPGTSWNWPARPQVRSYCGWTSATSMSREEAKAEYGRLFRCAIEDIVEDGDVIVPLSGGRDSRHILLELNRIGRAPSLAFTVERLSNDAQIAREVAAALGVPHRVVRGIPISYDRERTKNELISFSSVAHGWGVAARNFLAGLPPGVVYDGLGGDILSAGLFQTKQRLALYERQDLGELAEHLLGSERGFSTWLDPALYSQLSRSRARARLLAELELHRNTINPVASFYFWTATRTHVAAYTFAMIPDHMRVRTPYLDTAVFDFLASLPASYVVDHRFHDETIRAEFPDFGVAFENKTKQPSAALQNLKFSLDLALRRRGSAAWIQRRGILRQIAERAVRRGSAAGANTPTHAAYFAQLGELCPPL